MSTRRSAKADRSLYADWSVGLLALNPVKDVPFEVGVRVASDTYVGRLVVPSRIGTSFKIVSLKVGARELLRKTVLAEHFSDRILMPSLMAHLKRGGVVIIEAVKVTSEPVSFVARVVGTVLVRHEWSRSAAGRRGETRRV